MKPGYVYFFPWEKLSEHSWGRRRFGSGRHFEVIEITSGTLYGWSHPLYRPLYGAATGRATAQEAMADADIELAKRPCILIAPEEAERFLRLEILI
jgi:hypothetical protein